MEAGGWGGGGTTVVVRDRIRERVMAITRSGSLHIIHVKSIWLSAMFVCMRVLTRLQSFCKALHVTHAFLWLPWQRLPVTPHKPNRAQMIYSIEEAVITALCLFPLMSAVSSSLRKS